MMREALAIARKDLVLEVRSKERFAAMVLFSLVVVLAFRFAFDLFGIHEQRLSESHFLIPPVLWATVIFAATLGLLTVFSKEEENRCIDALLLAPAPRSALYVGKLISSFLPFLAIAMFVMGFLAVFFPYDFRGEYLAVAGLLVLGTFGYAALGVTAAAVSSTSRMREVLLPVIMIPIALFTIIVPSINATSDVLNADVPGALGEVRVIAISSVIFVVVSMLVFDYLWEA